MKKNQQVKKPNLIAYFVYYVAACIITKFKYHAKINNKEFKQRDKSRGALIIYNHQNNDDHFFCSCACGFTRLTHVISKRFYYDKAKRIVFGLVRAITRFQFRPDMESTLHIKKAIKSGCVIAMAPRGQVSICGGKTYLSDTICKFLKMMDVDVYVSHTEGGYLANPKWRKNKRKSKIEVTLKRLITKEDLKTISNDDLLKLVDDATYSNDFNWQENHHQVIKSKGLAEGLENVIFYCPTCKNKYTMATSQDSIYCTVCNTKATFNKYGMLEGPNEFYKSENALYQAQNDALKNELKQPDFKFEMNVTIYRNLEDPLKLTPSGYGLLHFSKDALYYEGSLLDDPNYHKDFEIQYLVQIPFSPKVRFNIPDVDGLVEFVPDDLSKVTEFAQLIDCYRELRDNNGF